MHSNFPRSKILSAARAAICFLVILLTGSSQARAQLVEVDSTQRLILNFAEGAASNLPFVGSFISPFSSLFFGDPAAPSFEQMQSEWEKYTDIKFDEARRHALEDDEHGLMANLEQIIRFGDSPRGYDELENVQTILVNEVSGLRSNTGQTAGPSVFYYGTAVNLHLDCLKELVKRSGTDEEKLAWVNESNHFISRYGADYNSELVKGAAERVDKVSVDNRVSVSSGLEFKITDPNLPQDFQGWIGRSQLDVYHVKVANDFYNLNAKLCGLKPATFDYLLGRAQGQRKPSATTGPKSEYNPGPDAQNAWTARRYLDPSGNPVNYETVALGSQAQGPEGYTQTPCVKCGGHLEWGQ